MSLYRCTRFSRCNSFGEKKDRTFSICVHTREGRILGDVVLRTRIHGCSASSGWCGIGPQERRSWERILRDGGVGPRAWRRSSGYDCSHTMTAGSLPPPPHTDLAACRPTPSSGPRGHHAPPPDSISSLNSLPSKTKPQVYPIPQASFNSWRPMRGWVPGLSCVTNLHQSAERSRGGPVRRGRGTACTARTPNPPGAGSALGSGPPRGGGGLAGGMVRRLVEPPPKRTASPAPS